MPSVARLEILKKRPQRRGNCAEAALIQTPDAGQGVVPIGVFPPALEYPKPPPRKRFQADCPNFKSRVSELGEHPPLGAGLF